jgi:hypothetical protein
MRLFRFFLVSFFLAGSAFAQTGDRGSTPPGQSQDGAGPSDGALKGGAILPGEQSGVPAAGKGPSRCEQLTGTLREDCLKQEQSAAGATGASVEKPAQGPPSPPVTAPPQNPR